MECNADNIRGNEGTRKVHVSPKQARSDKIPPGRRATGLSVRRRYSFFERSLRPPEVSCFVGEIAIKLEEPSEPDSAEGMFSTLEVAFSD